MYMQIDTERIIESSNISSFGDYLNLSKLL